MKWFVSLVFLFYPVEIQATETLLEREEKDAKRKVLSSSAHAADRLGVTSVWGDPEKSSRMGGIASWKPVFTSYKDIQPFVCCPDLWAKFYTPNTKDRKALLHFHWYSTGNHNVEEDFDFLNYSYKIQHDRRKLKKYPWRQAYTLSVFLREKAALHYYFYVTEESCCHFFHRLLNRVEPFDFSRPMKTQTAQRMKTVTERCVQSNTATKPVKKKKLKKTIRKENHDA